MQSTGPQPLRGRRSIVAGIATPPAPDRTCDPLALLSPPLRSLLKPGPASREGLPEKHQCHGRAQPHPGLLPGPAGLCSGAHHAGRGAGEWRAAKLAGLQPLALVALGLVPVPRLACEGEGGAVRWTARLFTIVRRAPPLPPSGALPPLVDAVACPRPRWPPQAPGPAAPAPGAIMVAFADAECIGSANITDTDLPYFGGEEPTGGADWLFRRVRQSVPCAALSRRRAGAEGMARAAVAVCQLPPHRPCRPCPCCSSGGHGA